MGQAAAATAPDLLPAEEQTEQVLVESNAEWIEAGSLIEGSQHEVTEDGKPTQMVEVDLIVEGFGNKRDNHYYTRELLEREAPKFVNTQMYVNHLSKEAQAALDGLPRPVEHLAGRIREAKVVVGADGKARVRAKASVSRKSVWELIEHDPDLLGVSINARGNSRAGSMEGRSAKIVEAINDIASTDWVTKAGAGGKVVSLMEAAGELDGTDGATATAEKPETTEPEAAAAATATEPETTSGDGEAAATADSTAGSEGAEASADAAASGGEGEPAAAEGTEETAQTEAGCDHKGAGGKKFCPECGAKMTEAAAPAAEAEAVREDPENAAAAEAEEEGEEVATEEAGRTFEIPQDATDEQVREAIARAIEERAQELAEERVDDAVEAALSVANDEHDRQLSEAVANVKAEFETELKTVEQRGIAYRMIEAADDLPEASRTKLKKDFHDRHFQSREAQDDKPAADAEAVCREAVTKAIDDKREEITEAAGDRRSRDGGETETSSTTGGSIRESERPSTAPRQPAPRKAKGDQDLDRRLGIAG